VETWTALRNNALGRAEAGTKAPFAGRISRKCALNARDLIKAIISERTGFPVHAGRAGFNFDERNFGFEEREARGWDGGGEERIDIPEIDPILPQSASFHDADPAFLLPLYSRLPPPPSSSLFASVNGAAPRRQRVSLARYSICIEGDGEPHRSIGHMIYPDG